MKVLNLRIHGLTDEDIVLALQEMISQVEVGNTSGFNSNETGGFAFDKIESIPEGPRAFNDAYCLYQADQWSSYDSAIPFGIFTTETAAIDAAKENGLYHPDATVFVKNVALNNCEEVLQCG
jgi:hypothetical protein